MRKGFLEGGFPKTVSGGTPRHTVAGDSGPNTALSMNSDKTPTRP